MSQLFLYRPTAELTEEDLHALRRAGIVPIKVADFDDVRLVDPLIAHGSGSAVFAAAVEAIAKANGNEGPKTLFGKLLAEKLASTTVFGNDGKPMGS
jgi:hypothetical protein